MRKILLATFILITLATCSRQDNGLPSAPQQVSDSAVGHYCSMNLIERNGPKAQILLSGKPEKSVRPSTIRQMFGYIKLFEESRSIHVIYVVDMSKVKDWGKSNANTEWIDARKAYYVIESSFIGGIGTEDAFPFANEARAEKLAKGKNGRAIGFARMPDEYISK